MHLSHPGCVARQPQDPHLTYTSPSAGVSVVSELHLEIPLRWLDRTYGGAVECMVEDDRAIHATPERHWALHSGALGTAAPS
ncbi:uncharacterized protein L3040_005285 [Drepanopeziza brunnea f. sp. 'multigermtubi']|uniref:uncharacterized protein n=1 Tax=Drepanopeziza brunnea f. sp. 'multigermtubi' TaxID=698441 RepID=UPI002384D656|nr:hypothetical protein L3040_005285 [Drepanopeziza brunnea f. sp. 'multigermtubi']